MALQENKISYIPNSNFPWGGREVEVGLEKHGSCAIFSPDAEGIESIQLHNKFILVSIIKEKMPVAKSS